MKIVRTDRELQTPILDEGLRAMGHDLVLLPDGVAEGDLIDQVREADLLLMCYTLITRRVIETANQLRGIVKYGVGIDAIDIPAARERGIVVVNVPDYAAETVAEGAFALLISLARKLPALFHKGLLNSVEKAGASIAGNTRVTAIEGDGGRFNVATELGPLSAREVLVTTNGYTGPSTPWLRRRIIPIQSQIIATEALPPETMDHLIPERRMVLDYHRLHNYFRPSPDGKRILFGGRSGATEKDPHHSGAHLFRQLTTVFPELATTAITHSWSGLTGYTFDKFPHLGVQDGIHFATGFCGRGVVWAPYLGHLAALRVLGTEAADCLFDKCQFPSRPLYYGRPWFLPVVIHWFGLLDRLRV